MTDLTNILRHIDNGHPQLLRRNRKEDNAEFLLRVVQAAPAFFASLGRPNEQVGLLSKSGGENGHTWANGTRTSHDAIAYPGGPRVDIIGGSDSPGHPANISWNVLAPHHWRPSNVWIDVSSWPMLDTGIVVPPTGPPTLPTPPVQPPTPPPPPVDPFRLLPGRGEAMEFGGWLDAYYHSTEGLQRTKGASINDRPDWEAVGAWMFDVWLRARMLGASEAEARDKVRREIQLTDEWRAKHP